MAKKISGSEYPLAKIFSSDFEYIIPSYQRPYAWTVDQTTELFDDLYDFFRAEKEDGYFLGSIVLIKEEGRSTAQVVDGQQRLTTLTILLAAIASRKTGDDQKILCGYLMEAGNKYEGLASKPRLTLRERDREFFTKYVQGLQFESLLALGTQSLANESQKNIQKNSEKLLERIAEKFGDDATELDEFVGFLLGRCFLIAVSTPNEQSAFRIFSVMNSRGLDLQPTDIIKADIIGKIPDGEQDRYNERWEELEVQLGRNGFNDLFVFIRMIYAKEKARRSVLDEFRTHVLPKVKSPEALIRDFLEPYGEAMTIAKECAFRSESDAQKINDYLRWLNRIDNSDWLPPAIFFLSRHKDNPAYVLWFFERLERLAAYMHIRGRNINQRIERYATVLAALEAPHDLANPVDAVELTEEEKKEMTEQLNGSIYHLSARRRNYLMLRLDSFISDGAASYDSGILTIEHVLPQTVNGGSEWATWWPDAEERESWVHRLANLVPLNKRRNIQAQNYDFDLKKRKYFQGGSNVSSYALTSQVLGAGRWTPDVVKARQVELLSVLKENWRLEPTADAPPPVTEQLETM